MLANYHTHTPRCNHAEGSERSYVERALAGGLRELGFSDHTPYFFDVPGYYSTFRMRPEQLPDYMETLLALRAEYAGRIQLHIGLETEYYPKLFPRLLDYLRQFPLDYLILGQHALYNETEGVYSPVPTADRRLLDRYRDQSLEALESGLFSCFAHPDLFCFTGDRAILRRHARAIARRCRELQIPLEYNLLGLRYGRHYPDPDFWQAAGEEGCPVILGSDAHAPENVIDEALNARAVKNLASYGLTPIEKLPLRPIQ